MINKLFWNVEKGIFERGIQPPSLSKLSDWGILSKQPAKDQFEREPKMNAIPDKLKSVWEKLLSAEDHNDVYDTMDNAVKDIPGFKEDPTDPLTYYYQNYRITQGLSMHLDQEVQNVHHANTLGLSSSPSLVIAARLKTGHTFMLTQGDHAWVPFAQNQEMVTPEAKQKFLDEMKKLAEQGYVHSFGAKGNAHWFVNPETKQIMLNRWSSVRALEAGETPEEVQKRFEKTLKAQS